jgi:hypothetical protein
MEPTIGRIVHYTSLGDKDGIYPPEQQAAIITRVRQKMTNGRGWYVQLHIFFPTGQFDMDEVPFSETYERGCWSWPPRV